MAVMEILKEQSKQRHKTCIIVTHDERLTKFCDKVFHMEDGRLKEKYKIKLQVSFENHGYFEGVNYMT